MNKTPMNISMMAHSSLFTALIIVGAYIRLPIGPVPITLSSFFVLLSPLLLGKKWALISVSLYLFLGAVGFPVFSAGGGIILFLGPTGGYLLGYLPAVLVTGIIAGEKRYSAVRTVVGLCSGTVAIYAVGITRLKFVLELSWAAAFSTGIVPFIIGDGIKITAAAAVKAVLFTSTPGLFPLLENQSSKMKKANVRGVVP